MWERERSVTRVERLTERNIERENKRNLEHFFRVRVNNIMGVALSHNPTLTNKCKRLHTDITKKSYKIEITVLFPIIQLLLFRISDADVSTPTSRSANGPNVATPSSTLAATTMTSDFDVTTFHGLASDSE